MRIYTQKSRFLVATLLTLSMTNALAAKQTIRLPKEDPNAFTLDMAKQEALSDGGVTTVLIAKEQIDEAKGAVDSAHGLRSPTFSANVGIGVQNVMGGGFGSSGTHNIGVTYPLLNNAITTTIASSKHIELSKEQLFKAQLNQAMLLVAIDYYEAVKANKDLVVAQNLLSASRAFYNSEASKLKSAGIGSPIDTGTAKNQVDVAQIAVTNALAAASNACTNLVTLINNVGDSSVCAHLVDPSVPGSFDVDVEAAVKAALNSRPEIAANQNMIASAQDLRNGVGGLKNHLTVNAAATNGSGANSGISGVIPRNGSTTTAGVTIGLTWGGTDKGDIEQANSRIDQANTMLTDAQKSIRKDVMSAITTLNQAYTNKATAQIYYDDAMTLVNTYQAQAKAGVNILDSTAYVQDLKSLQQAQQALFEADCNVSEAIAQLEASVGASYTMDINQFFAQSGLLNTKKVRK